MYGGGCCCDTDSCSLFLDEFTVDNLATDYAVTGSPTVSGGTLNFGGANELVICNTTVTETAVVVRAEFDAVSNDVLVLVISYVDASNYWYAQLSLGSAGPRLRIYEKVAGVDTQRASVTNASFSSGSSGTLKFCYANGNVSASVLAGGGSVLDATSYAGTITTNGRKAGVGTGSSGSIAVTRFSIGKHSYTETGCDSCGFCAACTDGSVPFQVQVDIEGLTANGCANCPTLNATYITQRSVPSPCCWYLDFSPVACALSTTYRRMLVAVAPAFPSLATLAVTMGNNVGAGSTCDIPITALRWGRAASSGNRDCATWNRVQLVDTTVAGSGGDIDCGHLSSFAYLTAL